MAIMNGYRNHRGFTLIELAIVLVIIGMLVSLGTSMVGPLTTFVKVRETKDQQDATLQSVTSWASSHNSIPDQTGFPTVVQSPKDAWDHDFIYLFDADLATATPTKDTICGRRSTPIILTTTTPLATINNVAFVVLSGADSQTLRTSLAGTLNGAPLNGIVTASGAATGTLTVTGPNGDLVRWVTLDELRSKAGCQGAPLKIVNNELPFGAVATPYSVTIVADGGVPFASPPTYKWCVNNLPAGFSQTGGVQSANCLTLAEAGWGGASSGLTISFAGGAVATGAYPITVVARDYADALTTSAACSSADPGDNCAQKLFVLTVNP